MRGQAMTETIVACIVLVPLFFAIPLLGKYMDIAHGSIQANRYTAWERTVAPDGGKGKVTLEAEARQRLLTALGTPIRPDDAQAGSGAAWQPNPTWSGYAAAPLLEDYKAVGLSLRNEMTPGAIFNTVVDKLLGAWNSVAGLLATITGADAGKFDIDVKGMYRGQISVTVQAQGAGTGNVAAGHPVLFEFEELVVRRRATVLVTDPWIVSELGPRQPKRPHTTYGQVAPLVPATLLSGWMSDFKDFVGGMHVGKIQPFKEFDKNSLQFGIIDESVPKDRIPPR